MSQWVPDPDAPLVDGCRVRIGDGPHEGTWHPYPEGQGYAWRRGQVCLDNGYLAIVPLGCPVTVLREVVPEREWKPGDVVRDAEHCLWLRVEPDAWMRCIRVEHTPVLPITLVPATPDADRCGDPGSGIGCPDPDCLHPWVAPDADR